MNPNQIQAFVDKVVEIQELTEKLKKWEACADNLIHYAKDFARYIEDGIYTNNPFSNHQNYQAVSNAITQYEKLKDLTDGN